MKLESTLKTHPVVLHTAPILDVVLLLLIFFLLGSRFVVQSGISVELPTSGSALPSVGAAHVITVTGGPAPRIYLNEDPVLLGNLAEALENQSDRVGQVIMRIDRSAPHGLVMEISNVVINQDFELYEATTPERRN
ncbi:MAG: biopolymer transporter ExbD [Verrucomicrobiota bacterium]